ATPVRKSLRTATLRARAMNSLVNVGPMAEVRSFRCGVACACSVPMAPHAPPYRELTRQPSRGRGRPSSQYWKLVLLVIAVAIVGLVALVRSMGAERRALLRIPAHDREVLYQDTFRSTESLCTRARTDAELQDRCVDAANFLLAFPECDEACRSLA